MTKVLALDTSSAVASVAVVDNTKILGEITYNYKRQHSTILIPMIDRILSFLDITVKDVDCIACSSGPGSFTGLRIGAATAKGLCHGADKPLIGIPTLDSLAFNMAYANGIICPIIDALRGNVYTAVYRWEKDWLKKQEDYMAISLEDLMAKLKLYDEDVILLGDGIFAYREKIVEMLGSRAKFAPVSMNMGRASSIAALAIKRYEKGSFDDYMSFVPFYLRKPQAEREYDKAHRGLV
ncbi:MAG TPA: tRNA (adenosine(37)-N6)-threonylcarbamoyltransferase complex dimerization subunit type 1 TsaB [Clostridiaceae bacterium]|nr:tRNA (adenosine(37)-N6)-threonylcarbamoyltransferase complex dimerization subunit type 1 TsaB [Clostridiaceae bacterium]